MQGGAVDLYICTGCSKKISIYSLHYNIHSILQSSARESIRRSVTSNVYSVRLSSLSCTVCCHYPVNFFWCPMTRQSKQNNENCQGKNHFLKQPVHISVINVALIPCHNGPLDPVSKDTILYEGLR